MKTREAVGAVQIAFSFGSPTHPNRRRFVKGLSNSRCAIDFRALREQNPNTFTRRRFYVAVFLSVSNDISCIPVA
jgi:hypothetical protein